MRWRRAGSAEARTLTLHIGTPKSATTFLQALLSSSRKALRDHRVLYPGAGYLPHEGLNQQPVMYAVAGPEVRWTTEEVRRRGERLLPKLVHELGRHRGSAVVSAEVLASFGPESIAALPEALGYRPDQVRVVVTARDFGRLMASVWQENVKNGATTTMDEYLTSTAALRGGAPSPFWTAYGLPGLVDRWADVVGLERVRLVTVPHAEQRDQLWPRFCRALGLTELPEPEPPREHKRNNISLTASQVQLLRQVNTVLDGEPHTHRERQRIRGRLLDAWMAAPGGRGGSLELGEALLADVRRWAEEDVAALRLRAGRGLDVQGDLDELYPVAARPGDGAGDDGPFSIQDAARDVLALLRSAEPQPATR